MRYVLVSALSAALLGASSSAFAQIGLYGSPGLVDLPAAGSASPIPYGASAAPYQAYPGQPTVCSWDAQPIPAPAVSWRRDPGYGDPVYSPDAASAAFAASLKRPKREPKEEPEKPVPKEAPSVIDEMLAPPGGDLPPPWGPEPGGGEGAACEPDWGDACSPCFQPNWYVSVHGLIMARGDHPNKVWTTYDFTSPETQLMSTDKELAWRGGGEIRFGRSFCCGAWTIEAGYWTLDPFTSTSSVTADPNLLATPLEFQDVVFADPLIVDGPGDLFNAAQEHRIWRRDEVHNVELNLIHNQVACPVGPFSCDWSVGARYFRFEESLRFGSLDEGGVAFGVDPTLEGYLDDHVVNNLVGAQMGCRMDYCRGKWALFAAPRAGIYNNHIRHRFSAYRGDGELFAPSPAGYPGYPVSTTKDVLAFLTEIDVGLEWQFAAQWSLDVGYRVTLATRMGLADHQIPFYVVDTPELADIDDNGYVLLHGGFAGLTYRF